MNRDLSRLSSETFDVVIVGGGIHGACAAWDATLRGLSVALVEKGDFCAATSANSLKIIHGGLRYLQQADFRRMRQSIRERSLLMRLAPHLVEPMPILVPIYGGLKHGRTSFRVAMALTDLIGFDRNRIAGSEGLIPAGGVVTREECLKFFAGFDPEGLRGGALWYDGHARNSERLVFEFLASAAGKGAALANYMEAVSPLFEHGRLLGVRVRDGIGGNTFDLKARVVLSAAGPWTDGLLGTLVDAEAPPPARGLALAINLVTHRRLADVAVGFRSKRDAASDPVGGGKRYLFLTPWRDSTIVGTYYCVAEGGPDGAPVSEDLLQDFVAECNEACPSLRLSLDEVTFYHWGLLPRRGPSQTGSDLELAGASRVVDHAERAGIPNLISVVGVKYTTARRVARTAIDRVFSSLGRKPPPCRTDRTPLVGTSRSEPIPSTEWSRRLAANYGGSWENVANAGDGDPQWTRPVSTRTPVLRCEVLWGVKEEMALKLADVVLRRTEMGTERCPDRSTLETVASMMGRELGWTDLRRQAEIDETLRAYALLPVPGPRREEASRHAER